MDAEQLKAMIADHYVGRRHVLYLRTANPVHAWSAYRTARQLEVAIPAWVLECFDSWAAVLTTETHTSAKAIADALKIGKKGGPLVTEKAARELRDLEIVADVVQLLDRPTRAELKAIAKEHGLKGDVVDPGDRNITEIMEQVAGERGLEYSSVKTICYKMIPALKRLAKKF